MATNYESVRVLATRFLNEAGQNCVNEFLKSKKESEAKKFLFFAVRRQFDAGTLSGEEFDKVTREINLGGLLIIGACSNLSRL